MGAILKGVVRGHSVPPAGPSVVCPDALLRVRTKGATHNLPRREVRGTVSDDYHLVIVGGGSAGQVAAPVAAALGARVRGVHLRDVAEVNKGGRPRDKTVIWSAVYDRGSRTHQARTNGTGLMRGAGRSAPALNGSGVQSGVHARLK
jgi:hypothetical protein